MSTATLLLWLVGPMQSWGTRSRFTIRDTEREPSKSGVIGLVCAAAGIGRDEVVPPTLTDLRMGVRVDRDGRVERDFQTTMDVARSSRTGHENQTSQRFYLADAAFLVGLEGTRDALEPWHGHLLDPVWPLFLGRRSFPPTAKISLPGDVVDEPLEDALRRVPMLVESCGESTRLVIEGGPDAAEVRRDQPLQPGFTFRTRQFTTRRVQTSFVPAAELLGETAR